MKRMAPMKSPEEMELEAKRAELSSLQSQLVEKELELATLESTLTEFNQRYLKIVGTKYSELDRIEVDIADRIAARSPSDGHAARQAREARGRAAASEAALNESALVPVQEPKSEELKRLYREAAKKVHPDLTDDPQERKRRDAYMARVNDAYRRGDEKTLRDLLEEWLHSPESVKGEGVPADLVKTIRRIAQAKKRLRQIKSRLTELMSSELAQLHAKAVAAESEGKDLLREMAESVEAQIAEARKRLRVMADS
jgi:hypothetical protein